MSVRINKAKNFKGKAYVAADELDNLIQSLTLNGVVLGSDVTPTSDVWNVNFTTADGGNANGIAVDLTAIKDYIDNKAIEVVAGNGVTIDTTDPLAPVISTNLKITKVATETGYAASYKLQYQSGKDSNQNPTYSDVTGDVINIVKDQFIKSAAFGWSTKDGKDDTADHKIEDSNWQAASDTTHKYPCIRIEVWTNADNITSSSSSVAEETDGVSTIFVPLADVFQEYVGSNGVSVEGNIISAVKGTSEQVSIADDSTVDVLTINGTGIGVTNIQKAINYAVNNEHAKASSAISSLDDKIDSLQESTSGAVADINTRIGNVATNAQTAISNASANLSAAITDVASKAQTAIQTVGAAVDAIDTNVGTAISTMSANVEQALDTVVANVNTAVSANVESINTNVGNAVTSVNTKVGNAVDTISGVIDNVQTEIGDFKDTVSATVSAVQDNVDAFKGSVNTAISGVVDNLNEAISATADTRNTQLASAVEIIDSQVTITALTGNANGNMGVTVEAKYIVAVYDNDGAEIYPEIIRAKDGNAFQNSYSLVADYGNSSDIDTTWHVLCARDLPQIGAPSAATTIAATYAKANNTVAFDAATNNASYEDVSYSNVTYTSADATNVAAVTYTSTNDVATTTVADGTHGSNAITVAGGNGATAPAKIADVAEAALDYTGHTNA